MKSRNRSRRLFTYLAMFAIALALPPIILAALATTYFASSERARLESIVDQTNADVARTVEATLIGTEAMLSALATSPYLQQGNFEGFDRQAREVAKKQSVAIMLSDNFQRQIINTMLPWAAPLPQTKDLEISSSEVRNDLPYASNLFVGSISGQKILRITVPVNIDHKNRFMLSATITPAHLSKISRESLESGPYFATVLDRNGVIIGRSSGDESFIGRPLPALAAAAAFGARGTWSGKNPQGVPIFVYWRRSQLSGWLLATGISQEALRAPLNRSLLILAVLTITLVAIAGAVALWVGRRITRAHASLVEMAGELGAGETLGAPVTPLAEANVVGRAIATASMRLKEQAITIRAAQDDLERRIEERTRELALKTALLATTLESMDQGLIAVDDFSQVTVCNRRARELLELPVDEMAPDIGWLHAASGLQAEQPCGQAAASAHRSFETERPNGALLEVCIAQVAQGGTIYALTDVTSARRHERELHVAKDFAEEASRAKTELLATMSHELRTPLNSVMGSADLLAADTSLNAAQHKLVNRMLTAGTALTTMMEDILDFAKVETDTFSIKIRKFSLYDLINDVKSISISMILAKNLTFKVSIDRSLPKFFDGDDNRLRQVLLNYINNAVKFTFAGGVKLTVSGSHLESGKWALRFAVTDTGIGISAEKQARLFQRYTQADDSIARRFGGTGLGLSICKRLVESMDGEVGVESCPGRGTILWFFVPLPEVAKRDYVMAPKRQVPRGSRLRILVAEDVLLNQEVARELLEGLGHDVTIVGSGDEAVDLVQESVFDLILMDILMSDKGGLEATRAIRALNHPARSLPIVACTANVLPAQIAEFRRAGLDGFVAKPLRRSELQSVVLRFAKATDAGIIPNPMAVSDDTPYGARKLIAMLGPEKARAAIDMLKTELTALASVTSPNEKRADVGRRAHSLISTTSLLGLGALSEKLRECEQVSSQPGNMNELLDNLRPNIQDAIIQIEGVRVEILNVSGSRMYPDLTDMLS